MRLQIEFRDRVGMAHDILAVLAARALNVVAVEVAPPSIYLEAPDLQVSDLPPVQAELLAIPDVLRVTPLAMLPGVRRQLYLDALLQALADPVLAVDAEGIVVVANTAAVLASGRSAEALIGTALRTLLSPAGLIETLLQPGHRLPVTEVTWGDQPYQLDTMTLQDTGGTVAGAVLTLHAPHRLGERLSALQNVHAGGFDTILGHSPAVLQLRQRAARMARVDAPLLIRGETGTGKELLAHACHAGSLRHAQPFFALNCAALPESLAESELFGYAPGAFTGALRSGRPGLLELADGGTLFLDEVGEMSPYLQAKLLRFLNDGTFRRVGGEREQKADVRIISATHRSLEDMVATGGFRQDLLFRLDVLQLNVPPLRERAEDIVPLAQLFMERACSQANRPRMRLTPAAITALRQHPWPGNVRQLQNVIFRAVTMSELPRLDVSELELADAATTRGIELGDEHIGTLQEAVENVERTLLQRLWPRYPSTRRLAERLGSSHSAIAVRLRKYGIG